MEDVQILSTNSSFFQSLFAYHIEALVPSSPQSAHTSQTPQKLSGNKDVHFFSVGNLNGRTLVIYMKKKGVSFCAYNE
jgi:RHO1 GDP-GTP exchange protein 1/2